MENSKEKRIAILGAGALGTVLGAYISKAGRQVDLIDSYGEHVEALNRFGARVTGMDEFVVPVRALTPDELTGTYDIVLYLTKQTANSVALPKLLPHLHQDSVICTLQNGLPEYRVGDYVGINRVMGAAVGWGATFVGPGVSCLTSELDTMHFVLGRLDGVVDERVLEVRDILELMCRTEVTENLPGIRWCKLTMNAAFSGLSTVLGCTFGDVLDDDRSLACAAAIAKECADVAQAADVEIIPIAGNDFNGALYYRNEQELKLVMERYRVLWDGQRKLKASMLQDIEKGKHCEVDAINGIVARYGKVYNVSTPKNTRIVELIKQAQAGGLIPRRENLNLLMQETQAKMAEAIEQ